MNKYELSQVQFDADPSLVALALKMLDEMYEKRENYE